MVRFYTNINLVSPRSVSFRNTVLLKSLINSRNHTSYKMNVCKLVARNVCKKISISQQIYSALAAYSSNVNIKIADPEELDKLYKSVELELKGNDPAVLNSYAKFSTITAGHLDVEVQSWAARKPQHDRLTLLKSVHIYKKHRVQYEYRTYFHFIKFKHLTGSTAETILEYLERNLPEGVALKATKVELQRIPEHIVPPTVTPSLPPA